jgi:hypothetical protein
MAGSLLDYFYAVAALQDGSILVAGRSATSGSGSDGLAMKLDAQGAAQWTTKWVDPNQNGFVDLAPAADGGLVLVGGSFPVGASASNRPVVMKLTSAGALEWASTDTATGGLSRILTNADGTFTVMGSTHGPGDAGAIADAYAVRLASTGVPQWSRVWNGAVQGSDVYGLAARPAGGFFAVGRKSTVDAGTPDGFLWCLGASATMTVPCDALAPMTPNWTSITPTVQPATIPVAAGPTATKATVGVTTDLGQAAMCR